jgi:regulator of protease activity HflC (stomatin/prohibitin superfamily)
MFLLIIGFIVLIASLALARTEEPFRKLAKTARIIGALLMIIGILSSSFKQVDAGFVGVKSIFGKVQNDVLSPGLNFVNPLVEVRELDTRTQNYTMSGINDEGHKSGDDAIKVLTADGLEVTIDLSVLYRLVPDEAPRLIKEIGTNYEDKIVRPITRTRIRDNAVYYEAVALYSTKRDEFQTRIFKTIDDDFRNRG